MDTQRRHQLRENELAQQLQSLGGTLREHRKTITTAAVVVVVVVVAGYLYANHREAARRDAWTALTEAQRAASAEERVRKLLDVADQGVDPAITRTALRTALEAALSGMSQSRDRNETAAAQRCADLARNVCDRIMRDLRDQADVVALARMAQAVLAEDRRDYAEAERIYREIAGDPALKESPVAAQAKFRLDHVNDWKQPVVFAPASVPASAPASAPAASQPPASAPTAPPTSASAPAETTAQ